MTEKPSEKLAKAEKSPQIRETEATTHHFLAEHHASPEVSVGAAVAVALNRIAESVESIERTLKRVAGPTELFLTDPLHMVTWYRQADIIRRNLEVADNNNVAREKQEEFSRAINGAE